MLTYQRVTINSGLHRHRRHRSCSPPLTWSWPIPSCRSCAAAGSWRRPWWCTNRRCRNGKRGAEKAGKPLYDVVNIYIYVCIYYIYIHMHIIYICMCVCVFIYTYYMCMFVYIYIYCIWQNDGKWWWKYVVKMMVKIGAAILVSRQTSGFR